MTCRLVGGTAETRSNEGDDPRNNERTCRVTRNDASGIRHTRFVHGHCVHGSGPDDHAQWEVAVRRNILTLRRDQAGLGVPVGPVWDQ